MFKTCDPCERLRDYLSGDGDQICFGEVFEALGAIEGDLNGMEIIAILAGT